MKNTLLFAALGIATISPLANAQFGSGVVYDPTQSTHAVIQIKNEERSITNEIQQIEEGQKIFTNTVKLTDNAIATYNLAHQMMMVPRSLYQPFLSRSTYWMELNHAANTYGNSGQWTIAVNTGAGASIGYQQVSIPHTGQINGFGNLSQLGQQQIAARGATADLNDAITVSGMQTLGTIRTNSTQRQADINALIGATQSADLSQHTELATLQRINLALILLLQEQQEANQISQANTLQQIVGQKTQQDNLKSLFQVGNGYQQSFNAATPQQTSAGTNWAFHY
ncbi:MAG: hypothetical protein ABSG96_26325 [Terracidiphilus sp.]|jgi:hypothetical protein